MKTWDAYKNHVKKVDPDAKRDIEEMENIAAIVSKMVEKRNDLGITQRDLAAMCGIPQSSVARIVSENTESGYPAEDHATAWSEAGSGTGKRISKSQGSKSVALIFYASDDSGAFLLR